MCRVVFLPRPIEDVNTQPDSEPNKERVVRERTAAGHHTDVDQDTKAGNPGGAARHGFSGEKVLIKDNDREKTKKTKKRQKWVEDN